MKKIWNFLVQHVREDFNAWHYLLVALFLAASIYLNYHFNFQDNVLGAQKGWARLLHYFVFYSSVFYFTALSYLIFSKKLYILVETDFWVKSIVAILILSADGCAPLIGRWINTWADREIQLWLYKVSVNLVSYLIIVLPLFFFYKYYDKEQKNFYGISARKFDFKPYVVMMLIMIPLIAVASFHKNFLVQYPMYKVSEAHTFLHVEEWVTVLIYEIAYGSDFFTVEFLFRGFMVIGLMSVLGRGSVLCMAAAYCFLHFGKPSAEAISSIFGGYILGVIAYETKSIWGGILIHIGIAWSMELAAYLQMRYD
jgi:hypothetical protein